MTLIIGQATESSPVLASVAWLAFAENDGSRNGTDTIIDVSSWTWLWLGGDFISPSMTPTDRGELYHNSGYWNDYPDVAAEQHRRIFGTMERDYLSYFRTSVAKGRAFARSLFFNCGNGWVERSFYDAGVIGSGVGIDTSGSLLDKATVDAGRQRLQYVRTDVDTEEFPSGKFDSIVNHVAAHHVRYIDLCFESSLTPSRPTQFFSITTTSDHTAIATHFVNGRLPNL